MKIPAQNFNDVLERFYKEKEILNNLSPHTIESYKASFNLFKVLYQGISNLNEFTKEKVERLLVYGKIEKHWNNKTFINHRNNMSGFCTWCVKKGLFEKNFVKEIEKPRLEKSLPKALNKEDALKIIDTAFNLTFHYRFPRYRNRALFSLMIFAGLRLNECLTLKLSDIDIVNDMIYIQKGKGNRDRNIPIVPQLKIYLKTYIDERIRLQKSHIYFISSTNRDKPMTKGGVYKIIKQIRKKTKLEWSNHKLRHTFATLMLEGGVDIFSLKELLGHSDIRTTSIYLSVTGQRLKQQMYKHPLN